MSEYEKITTARELINMVRIRGLSTKTEDICRAQDIIGHTTEDKLDELANEAPEIRNQFYHILFHIWSWEDATRYYNQHTNPEYKKLRSEADKVRGLEAMVKQSEKYADDLAKKVNEGRDAFTQQWNRAEKEKARAEAAEAEIVKLKAKLYDLMMQEK